MLLNVFVHPDNIEIKPPQNAINAVLNVFIVLEQKIIVRHALRIEVAFRNVNVRMDSMKIQTKLASNVILNVKVVIKLHKTV